MESSNLYHHHHQLQEQCFGYGLSSLLDWNPSMSVDEDEYCKRHLDGLMFPMSSAAAGEDAIPGAIQQQYYHQPPSNAVLQHNLFDLNRNVFLGASSGGGGGGQFSAARFGSMDSSPPSNSLVSSISTAYTENGVVPIMRTCNHFPGNTTSYFGARNFHEPIHSPSSSSSNKATVKNEVLRTKRLSAAAMPSHQEQPKKPRIGSQRPSCPVLKVRKEKLGDRIAALHRLVAPFGKTDTASVLTEAIGYIHFLHDQIHALSLPYMKSCGDRSHPHHRKSRGHEASNMKNEDDKTALLDLKSRGLCLVPLSLTSYLSSCQGIYMAGAN